jgi:hypothetical protein
MEDLEERNEMFETPLIRESADGNSKNVLLLLEAGADVEAQQDNSIGFTSLHQAGACLLLYFLFSQLGGPLGLTMRNVQPTLVIPSVWCSFYGSGRRLIRLTPLEALL